MKIFFSERIIVSKEMMTIKFTTMMVRNSRSPWKESKLRQIFRKDFSMKVTPELSPAGGKELAN